MAQAKPGTELLLLGGMLKTIVAEGLEQVEWLQDYCHGWTNSVRRWSPWTWPR